VDRNLRCGRLYFRHGQFLSGLLGGEQDSAYDPFVALVRFLADDEYRPEFSSVVIRDVTVGTRQRLRAPLLNEGAGPLWGTVGRAGAGWLQLAASDQYERVRLEAHDAGPPPESEDWRDVLETPYYSGTGTVGLTSTTGGNPGSGLELGPPGYYRARVCRRPADDEGDVWVVRFWAGDVRPPQWLVRGPIAGGSVTDDVYALVSWAPDGRLTTSAAELAEALLVDVATVGSALRGDYLIVEDSGSALVVTGVAEPDDEDDEFADEGHDEPDPGPADAGPGPAAAGFVHQFLEEYRLAGLRRRPPPGPPPRTGYVNAEIVMWRGDRLVTVAACPLNDPHTAAEVAGGVVVAGDHIVGNKRYERAAYATWDGSVVDLGALRANFQISPDGTVLAAYELGTGRRGQSFLHLIDLADDTRHALAMPASVDLHITGVTRDTVWYRPRRADPAEMCWTAGRAEAVPATGPPPVGSWEGPVAPEHRHYAAHHCGRSFHAGDRITVDDAGGHRTYRVPAPGRVDHRVAPVWEDPDHLLLVPGATVNGGLEFHGCLLRLDVTTGALQTVATDTVIGTFIWPWPRRG